MLAPAPNSRSSFDSSIAAVVTGGASGLGEGTARAIAATGAKVALFDLNEGRGEEVAASLGERAHFAGADVRDEEQVRQGVNDAAELGELRIAVACAAVGLVGRESELLRFTVKKSLGFLAVIMVITYLQAYVVPGMIPQP